MPALPAPIDARDPQVTKERIRVSDPNHRLSHVSLAEAQQQSTASLHRVSFNPVRAAAGSASPQLEDQRSLLDGGNFDYEQRELTNLLKSALDVSGTPANLIARGKTLARQQSRQQPVEREFRVFHGKRVVWRWRAVKFEEEAVRVAESGTQRVFFASDIARVLETTTSRHKNLVEVVVTIQPDARFPQLSDVEAISAHGLFLLGLQARMPVAERLFKWASEMDEREQKGSGELALPPSDFADVSHPYQQLIAAREEIERETPTLLGGPRASPDSPSSAPDEDGPETRRGVLPSPTAGPGGALAWAAREGWSPEERPVWDPEAVKDFAARVRQRFEALLDTSGWGVCKVSAQGTPVYERPPDAKDAASLGAPLLKAVVKLHDVSADQLFAMVWDTGRRGCRDLALRHIKLEYVPIAAPMATFRPRDTLLLASFVQDPAGDYIRAGRRPPRLRRRAGGRGGAAAAGLGAASAAGYVRAKTLIWGFAIKRLRGAVEVTHLEQVDLRAKAPTQVEEAARDWVAARLHHIRRAVLSAAPSLQKQLPRETDEPASSRDADASASPHLALPSPGMSRRASSPHLGRRASRDPARLLAPTAASLAPRSPEVIRPRSASISPAPPLRRSSLATSPAPRRASPSPTQPQPASPAPGELPFLRLSDPPLRRRASHI
eukprot:tig00001371_g8425.t1